MAFLEPDTQNVQSELDRIRDEALGIREQLNQMEGRGSEDNTNVSEQPSFSSPTFQTQPSFNEIYPSTDENQIREDTMGIFQQQIDATNEVYDQLLNEARQEGQGRLGSQRAVSARGGLLGSDFGAAQKENVVDKNAQIRKQLQAERLRALGGIRGDISNQVLQQMQEKRLARQQGADFYIDYLTRGQERRDANMNTAAQAFLAQGIDPTTLDDEELNALAEEAGLSTQDIISRYAQLERQQQAAQQEADLDRRMTEAEIAEIENEIAQGNIIKLSEGNMLYNVQTGETFKNPKTSSPGSGSGSDSDSGSGKPMTFWERNQAQRQDGVTPPSWMTRAEYDQFNRKNAGLSSEQKQHILDNITFDEGGNAVYSPPEEGGGENVNLSRDYFTENFTEDELHQMARNAGKDHRRVPLLLTNADYDRNRFLDFIEDEIQTLREEGNSDSAILDDIKNRYGVDNG